MGVYVVTGGSGGIGGKTVEILRSQGHEVVNVDLKDSDICANLATKEGRDEVIHTIHAQYPDGIDGLATGVTMPVMLFFTAVACFWGQLELGIFSAGLFGGLCGFLIYNFHPAKVFMGDTGSLFLGGAVCGLAFALDIPLVLILVGIIYILETLSDILQVGYFKLTHGKRIFRMAPLHHHLELGGWSEVKLFCVFSGVTLLACVLAFLGVMGR